MNTSTLTPEKTLEKTADRLAEDVFLSAEWRNLLLVTYAMDPQLLTPYLPPNVELDTIDGQAFASLVAFEFKETRLRGFKIPFHVNFPEVNLRFYVKRKEGNQKKRGVVFIRELVPKPAISIVANALYNERYRTRLMGFERDKHRGRDRFNYRIFAGGHWQKIRFSVCEIQNELPAADSLEHFFKEHDRGFGVSHRGQPLAYRVEHPHWRVYSELDYDLSMLDYGKLFGPKWSFLNSKAPYHAMAAMGSPVKIYKKHD